MSASITIQWRDKSKNESGFEIERCQGESCTGFVKIANVAANVTTYTDTGLAFNTFFRYRVRAVNARGKSSYSNTITAQTPLDPDVPIPTPTVPAAPSGIACSAGDKKNTITFNPVTGAAYTIKKSLISGGPYSPIVSGLDATVYIDTNVENDTQYFYVATANVLGVNSLNSSQVSGTPTAAVIPIPGDALTTFELGNGWATFPVVLPFGYADVGLKIGDLPTQVDVKNRWDDNSIKLAIVTAKIPSSNTYSIRDVAATAGTITPTIPSCIVTITYEGTNYTATMPSSLSDLWLNGPNCKEGSSEVSFNGHGGAANLRAIFDTRVYNDNSYRIVLTIKNNRNAVGAKNCPINMSVSINGQVVYTETNLVISYLCQFSKVLLSNGLIESTVTPDFEVFHLSGALPRYQTSGARNPDYTIGTSKFGPLKIGDLIHPINAPGIRPDIGLLPEWAAHYIHFKKASAKEYTLENGRNVAGAIGLHFDNADGTLFKLSSANSSFWLFNFSSDGISGPLGDGSSIVYAAEVGAAHTPQLSFLPYLLTGDRTFLREMKYWANHCMISILYRRNEVGITTIPGSGVINNNQVRDSAWGMRDLSICAAWLPDDDADKSYFEEKLADNVTDLNYKITQEACTTLGGSQSGQPVYNPISMWMQCYCVWAWDQMVRFGQTPPNYHARIIDYWNDLFNSDPAFDKRFSWSYHFFVTDTLGNKFTTFAQLFNYNYNLSPEPWKNFNLATATVPPIELGYGCEIRIILGLAYKNALSNALVNMSYVDSVENSKLAEILNVRFQFAIKFT